MCLVNRLDVEAFGGLHLDRVKPWRFGLRASAAGISRDDEVWVCPGSPPRLPLRAERRPSYCKDLVNEAPIAGDDSGDVAVMPGCAEASSWNWTVPPLPCAAPGTGLQRPLDSQATCRGPACEDRKACWRGAVVGLVSQVANEDLRVCPASHRLTLAEGLICWLLSPLPSRTDRSMNSFRRESSACALDC